MTNYEYVKTLSAEELAKMFLASDCPYCIENDANDCTGKKCFDGIMKWLQQEHEEPTKMVDANEIVKGIERGTYCKSSYCKLAVFGHSCEGAECITAIKNYIKAMEGASDEM